MPMDAEKPRGKKNLKNKAKADKAAERAFSEKRTPVRVISGGLSSGKK